MRRTTVMYMTKSVRYAAVLWFVAVAAGVGETAIRVTGGLVSGSISGGEALSQVAMRTIVYGAVVAVIIAMRGGQNWARLALAWVLGTVGMLSLVVEPVAWLAVGGSFGALVASADLDFYAIAALRTIHIVAVPAAIIAMFTPTANRYFRTSAGGGVEAQSKRVGSGVS